MHLNHDISQTVGCRKLTLTCPQPDQKPVQQNVTLPFKLSHTPKSQSDWILELKIYEPAITYQTAIATRKVF